MQKISVSTSNNEQSSTSELEKMASFLYEMTKSDLPKGSNRHFSFYDCISKKISAFNTQSFEEELLPIGNFTGQECIQSPAPTTKCPNTEDNTKPNHCAELSVDAESKLLETSPNQSNKKVIQAANYEESIKECQSEDNCEDLNEVFINVTIFTDDRIKPIEEECVKPHTENYETNQLMQINNQSIEEIKQTDKFKDQELKAEKMSISPLQKYYLDGIKCTEEETVIYINTDPSDLKKLINPKVLMETQIKRKGKSIRKFSNLKIREKNEEVQMNLGISHHKGIKSILVRIESDKKKLNGEQKYLKYCQNFIDRVKFSIICS